MRIATLSIGDELLCGEVVDTNASHIASRLFDAGSRVLRHLTVGDDEGAISRALGELAGAFDAVVVTGGLGPTPDDLTAAAAARAAGTPLEESGGALAHLAAFSERIQGGLHPANRRQALIPAGAPLIPNPLGTACGFVVTIEGTRFFFLPGVPFEMKRMLEDTVLPALKPGPDQALRRITLKIFGISEAAAAELVAGVLPAGLPVELAYCVKFPEIHLILRSPARHRELLEAAAAKLRGMLSEYLFAEGDATMDTELAALFRKKGVSLALAESCTGGLIAARITGEPGSSAYFLEGNVTYSNPAKTRMLQVPAGLIEAHGAVSAEVACAMALGARLGSPSDLALSVTGVAGPDGGTPEKPVGTVFIALADASGCSVNRFSFPGDRASVRQLTCFSALDWLRKYLLALS